MAKITISNLGSTNGSELFQDSESFLDYLNEREIEDIKGGILIIGGSKVLCISGKRCQANFD